ncbi:MAG: TIGR01244 family sulfur transferase [Hyphomicrobium sp.]
MPPVKAINARVSVAGALTLHDLAHAAHSGFRTIVNFRPDGEGSTQVASAAARIEAARLGLNYVFIPATKHELFTDDVIAAAQAAFSATEGPVLAHCAGGQRAAIVWAATEARNQRPVDDILADLSAAGFDFAFLRDDLDAQADRPRWTIGAPSGAAPQISASAESRKAAA